MRDITLLHPRCQSAVYELQKLCEAQGLKIIITETLRTKQEQDALYAKGRTVPGKKVTNAKGSTYSSMHQWGIAFDFARGDSNGAYNDSDGFFTKVGKIGEGIGLEWGGNWTSIKDKPHFQLPDWGSGPAKLKKMYASPENFMKEWEEDSMTISEKREMENLRVRIAELEKNVDKVYHYGVDIPDWARPTMDKLISKGLYKGASESDLNLPESLMRVLVINDRAGLYDK